MNKIHHRRLYFITFIAIGVAIGTALILYALKQNINVFITPTQIEASHFPRDYHFRLGGMVKKGSLVRDARGLGVRFTVTDLKHETPVYYVGVLPDLFREGKGVIAEGHLDVQNRFIATQVLAKHDENYMPKNIAKELKQNARG